MSISIRETKPASIGGQPINIDNNTNNYNKQSLNYSPGTGMVPQGYWMNQHTGNIIAVDDMFNDSGQDGAQVKLSDGQIITFSQFANDYIQVESQDFGINSDSDSNNDNDNDNNYTHEPYFSLDEPIHNNIDNINKSDITIPQLQLTDNISEQSKTKQMVIDLINNLSNNSNKKPEVEIVNINIKNIPREALSSLIKYFNVTTSDIADVIFDKLVDKNIIKKCIIDYIEDVKIKARCKNL